MGHARLVISVLLSLAVAGCLSVGPNRHQSYPTADRPDYTLPDRHKGRTPRDLTGRTIVVDPGHGGKDTGAPGVGPVPEKVVNLAVSRRLAALLHGRGAKVVTTRDDDRFIELDDRAAIADRVRADLFISIHSDACPRPHVTGPTVYIARQAMSRSVSAAAAMRHAFNKAGIACRKVRRADFRVLVGHSRPAILLECGYMTNKDEAHRLATSDYQWALAEVIADGIAMWATAALE